MLESTSFQKISSAVFYGVSSFMITVVNKEVLTSYKFPSFLFLSFGQLTASIIVLFVGKRLHIVSFPSYSNELMNKIFPLPIFYMGNMVFGLGGTKALSLPMFAALRRSSNLLTMILEFYVLNVRPHFLAQLSIYGMVGGAIVAALNDLSFDLEGYTMIMLTNIFTAFNAVFIKKKLSGSDYGTYGLMFYNSLVMALPVFAITWFLGDLNLVMNYDQWTNPFFTLQFILSCFMGFVLNYSTVLCMEHNSALTTTTVGCLKNVTITYIGMIIGGDYIFSWLNFIGLNISVAASLVYAYVAFVKKTQPQKEVEKEKLLYSSETEDV